MHHPGGIDTIITALKQLKHRAFLLAKWVRLRSRPARTWLTDTALIVRGRVRPYRFDADRYPGSFVAEVSPVPASPARAVPETLTMFWFGDAGLSPNRRRGVESVRALNPDLDVRLLSREGFAPFLLDREPLHPAFDHLALTHQSDYLRCYLMHLHGGGYVDVKTIHHSWQPAFRRLAADPEKWALGYREPHHSSPTSIAGAVQDDVRRHFYLVIGNGAFIMRPGTPLTAEWYRELLRRMDHYAEALARHPGGVRGGEEEGEYPVPKHALLGDILGPLGLKYHDRLIIDESIRPDFTNYL